MNQPFKLETIGGGAVVEAFDIALQRVIENIKDPNTEEDKVRTIKITVKLKPNKERNICGVKVATEITLAGDQPIESTAMIDTDGDGIPVAVELFQGQNPGQNVLPELEIKTSGKVRSISEGNGR